MRSILCAVLGNVLILLAGCGPAVPEGELGQVILEVPKVPGSEKPYPLPKIPPPPGFHPQTDPFGPGLP